MYVILYITVIVTTAKTTLIDCHYNIASMQHEKIELEYFDKTIKGINVTILNTSNKHPAMLGIGSVHTATSSVYHLLCGTHTDTLCPSACWECGRYTQEFYYQYMEEHYSIPRRYRWQMGYVCVKVLCFRSQTCVAVLIYTVYIYIMTKYS